MSIQPGVYVRTAAGSVNLNTSQLLPGPAPVVPDPAFTLGVTEPTAANTGVRDPSLLTRFDGNITTTGDGQVIRNLDVYGRVVVNHADVVIENCIVRGAASPTAGDACILATSGSVARLLIDRVACFPQAARPYMDGIRGHDFTARRVHLRDMVDGFGIFNTVAPDPHQIGVRLEGCFVERSSYFSPDSNQPTDDQSHNDDCQVQSGFGLVVVGCAFRGVYGPAGTHSPSVTGTSPSGWPNVSFAWILLSPNAGPIGDLTVTDNWVYGFFLPMNVGGGGATNLGTWHRNRFDGLHGAGGSPLSKRADQTCDFGFGTPNTNVYMDGRPITTARSA